MLTVYFVLGTRLGNRLLDNIFFFFGSAVLAALEILVEIFVSAYLASKLLG